MKKHKSISQLRLDIVSNEWVAIAPGRSKRIQQIKRKQKIKIPPKSTCPFEDLEKSGHGLPILALDKNGNKIDWKPGVKYDWFLQVSQNKYPIVGKGDCSVTHRQGPHFWLEGAGFHEIVIYRDHARQPAYYSKKEIATMLLAFAMRHRALSQEDCVEYVLIYHNHGPQAGASIYHPHSQIIALPVIPPDVASSIWGSASYFKKHGRCVHCDMIRWEKKERKRIVYENKEMMVFCPFASRVSYEVRIFPKKHEYAFEDISESQRMHLADAMQKTLLKIAKGLGEPSYNFFVHTAPSQPQAFKYYHWH
ncbi:MAG: DUF4931 domain-containing protein, partial [Candidatus Paceibacteria bacterium]